MKYFRTFLVALMLAVVCIVPFQPVGAQNDLSTSVVGAPLTPEDVQTFLDEFMSENMESYGVPGLAFVMVKDGELFFSKGYGYADLENQVLFDPEQTIIRAGSMVKTVTALAVMQLVEQGMIELDTDVNQYLTQLQVPSTYDEPVTARQLLHYTAGFDARFIGIRVENADEIMPLGDYLAEHLTDRVRPPGEFRAYNDVEIALAGLLVEDVSGMPYDQYVEEHIFKPLGMDSTWIFLPQEEEQRAALGYRSNGQPYPRKYYYLNDAAGAGFNTTASDLARYMIMHLENGMYSDVQLIGEDFAEELHTTRFRHHPNLPGIAYAFDEVFWGDLRRLAKGGGAPGFQNRMFLIPDEKIGVYFVYNRDSNVRLAPKLEDEFLTSFFPKTVQPLQDELPLADPHELDRYDGYYVELNDYSANSLEKVKSLMEQEHVTVSEHGLYDGNLVHVGENLFQWRSSGNYVAFREDDQGIITHMFYARTAAMRVPWHETFPVQMSLLGFSLITFLSAMIGWLVTGLKGRGKLYRLSGSLILVYIAFLIGLGLLLGPVFTGADPPWVFSFAPPVELLVLLVLPLVGIALTLGLAWQMFKSWTESQGGRFVRIHNTLVLLASLGFLLFLNTWNLLGYQL